MKHFSIIIPVYNEAMAIKKLLKSIEKVNYPKDKYEVVVVNDCSTDLTSEILSQNKKITVVTNKSNKGRFLTRLIGAKNSKYKNLLFIDARSILDTESLQVLNKSEYKIIVGTCLELQKLTIFEIFYKSIRNKYFSRYYEDNDKEIVLEKQNFDLYPKGTGVLYVQKDIFFKTIEKTKEDFLKDKNVSDDTKLLKSFLNYSPIIISPALKIINYARSSTVKSITHLYSRGIKFVDYYFSLKTRGFYLVILVPLLILSLILLLLVFFSGQLYLMISIFGVLYVLFSAWLAGELKTFFKIAIILPVVVITFYTGVLIAIMKKILKEAIRK